MNSSAGNGVTGERWFPRCMSTQHPDNVLAPDFAGDGAALTTQDEVRETYFAFATLGCDEQLWDLEGKEVDTFLPEKLLGSHPDFFERFPLGERVFLTVRLPNPAADPIRAKLLIESLHGLPRHADVSRQFYGRERPPVFEVILPMTTSARELDLIRRYYQQFVARMTEITLGPTEAPLGTWLGPVAPRSIDVIPLLETKRSLLAAGLLARDHAITSELATMRVFVGRSDPALRHGMVSAALLVDVALDQLDHVGSQMNVRIFPIVGLGSAPFRGGLRPDSVERVLRMYPGGQTFTIQSAFKYDNDRDTAASAIQRIKATPRSAARPIADEPRALAIIDRCSRRYRTELGGVMPLVDIVAPRVPRRRARVKHYGAFAYARARSGLALPRAIPFCASMYSLGLPPEILGLSALDADDRTWLRERAPALIEEIGDALRFYDDRALELIPAEMSRDIGHAICHFEVGPRDQAHADITGRVRTALRDGAPERIDELILNAAAIRGFLG